MDLNSMLPQFLNMMNKQQPSSSNQEERQPAPPTQNISIFYPDTYLDSDSKIAKQNIQQQKPQAKQNNNSNMLSTLLPLLSGNGDAASMLSAMSKNNDNNNDSQNENDNNAIINMLASALSQKSGSDKQKNSPKISEFVDVDDYCFD